MNVEILKLRGQGQGKKFIPLTLDQVEQVNKHLEGSGYNCSPTGEFVNTRGPTGVLLGWAKGCFVAYRLGERKLWTGPNPRHFTQKYWYSP
jgi:hypothetical protein